MMWKKMSAAAGKGLLLAAVAAICVSTGTLTVCAAEGSINNHFQAVQIYTPGQYKDVDEENVFAPNVQRAWEYHIMQGYGDTFGVKSPITRLASIILADRIHCIYYNGVNDIDERYSGSTEERYLAYAKEYGIYCDFEELSEPAARWEYARILGSALPDEALPEINAIAEGDIPDVVPSWSYASDVYRLYRAGILTGNDVYGTFLPESNITRGAACAIATRMCDMSLRKEYRLQSKVLHTQTTPLSLSNSIMPVEERLSWVQTHTEPDGQTSWISLSQYCQQDGCLAYTYAEVGTPHVGIFGLMLQFPDGTEVRLPLQQEGFFAVALPETMYFKDGKFVYELQFYDKAVVGSRLLHEMGTYHYEVDLAEKTVTETLTYGSYESSGTSKRFQYDGLELEVSNVISVRTESMTDDGGTVCSYQVFTCFPNAEVTVIHADMESGELFEDNLPHAKWGIIRLLDETRIHITDELVNTRLDVSELQGVANLESSVYILAFEVES